jgi:hypothetical protein
MAIVRNPNREHYTVIDNRVLNDPRLSWRARGMAAHLLSKPDTWEVMKQNLINESPDGRKVVEATLSELESFGYIEREVQQRGDRGRFDSATTVIHEVPMTGFPQRRKPVKLQVAPRAETYNGEEAQVGTDVLEGVAVEGVAVEGVAVEVPRVKTEVFNPEEAKTEEVKPSCAFASENAGSDEEIESDQDLSFACQALARSILRLFPGTSAQSIEGLTREIVELIRVESTESEAPFALAAIADRMDNREWRIRYALSDPVETVGFVMGVARQVIENWQGDYVWKGAAFSDLEADWAEFVSCAEDMAVAQ